jgi:hypothetical protein
VETHIKSAQDAPCIESPVWLDMTDDLKGVYHKKIILVIALVMLLAFAPAASAATIPAGSITITLF